MWDINELEILLKYRDSDISVLEKKLPNRSKKAIIDKLSRTTQKQREGIELCHDLSTHNLSVA